MVVRIDEVGDMFDGGFVCFVVKCVDVQLYFYVWFDYVDGIFWQVEVDLQFVWVGNYE